MPLREQILSSPETLSDLAWAAQQRFREAETLLSASHFSGAVYLFGLATEMWLKIACFRSRGAGSATRVDGQLGPARLWMSENVAPPIPRESYHSLEFWAEYLIRWRQQHRVALSSDLTGQLRHHICRRLFFDWKIDMRYHAIPMSERDAWRVYNDAHWMRANFESLWR